MKHLAFYLCILIAFHSVSATPDSISAQSESTSQPGETTITHDQNTLQRRGYSADLLFNLGNACSREKQGGLAVLYYRRALLLDSAGSKDILQNLNKVQTDLGLQGQDIPAWRIRTGFFTLDTWTIIAFLSITLLSLNVFLRALAVTIHYLSEPGLIRFKQWNFICGCIAGLFALIAISAAIIQNSAIYEAVVIKKDVPLLVSPFEQAEEVNTLREGEVVEISREHGNYYLIDLGPGRTGWAEKSSVIPVIPEKSEGNSSNPGES